MNLLSHRLVLALWLTVATAITQGAEPRKINVPPASPECSFSQKVGFTTIDVTYSRPGVKGRTVFGGLLPYGEVWRTGANAATKIRFSTAVKFGGANVPAGEYALFSIPDPKEWTVILNKVTGQWGAYTYDQANDVVRVKAIPVKLAAPVETFTIDLNDIRDDSASLDLVWQETRVSVPLQVDVVPVVQHQIDAALAANATLTAGEYDAAAMFYLEHALDLKKAAEWIDAAIAQRPLFYFYYHKARILAKQGAKDPAREAAQKSIELAKAQGRAIADEYTRLNQAVIESLGQ